MIKAYLAGISTYYEGEDIEIRYRIYEGEKLVTKTSIFKEYKKPAVVTMFALRALLKELEKHKDNEITIIVNDTALKEQINETTKTKNRDVLKMASLVREELKKFNNSITIKDISENKEELVKWNDVLQP